ncbi:MAG: hypothetical protein DME33_04480 [Verrucomicrobia bacterium]|nr:MAG: hypothetical protein DME33_04480 [Verrucomicrobiota bacterium]
MERLGELRHRRAGRRLSERAVSTPNLSILSVLQHISAKIVPIWVQSIHEANFLRSRSLLQLRFTSDRVANVAIVLVTEEFPALLFGSES